MPLCAAHQLMFSVLLDTELWESCYHGDCYFKLLSLQPPKLDCSHSLLFMYSCFWYDHDQNIGNVLARNCSGLILIMMFPKSANRTASKHHFDSMHNFFFLTAFPLNMYKDMLPYSNTIFFSIFFLCSFF